MFFIGIFGIDQAEKQIGTCNNTICPSCGVLTRFEIFKTNSVFHVFFIPTIKWDVKYYAKSACCGQIDMLDPVLGQQYERGQSPEIRDEHLTPLHYTKRFKTCSACGSRVEPGDNFCPHCGSKLS